MGRTPRVLVIDDDRLLCELIRTTFELEGYAVDTAYDVIEAERVLVESRPDAILLDIGLPGIDGIFYLERLRETPQTRKIPIVAISGSDEAGRTARAVGAEAFLRKPFSPLELIALVTPLIRQFAFGQIDEGRDVVDAADLNRLIEIGRRQHQLLTEAYTQTVAVLASALESRDFGTSRHSPRGPRWRRVAAPGAGTRAASPRTRRGSRSRSRRGCSTIRVSNGASSCTTSGRSAFPTGSSSSPGA